MWVDFLNKLLQGKKFMQLRKILMNHGDTKKIEKRVNELEKQYVATTETEVRTPMAKPCITAKQKISKHIAQNTVPKKTKFLRQ